MKKNKSIEEQLKKELFKIEQLDAAGFYRTEEEKQEHIKETIEKFRNLKEVRK